MNELPQEEIIDILTLRYHPKGDTLLPRRKWKDFEEINASSSEALAKLENTVGNFVEKTKSRKPGVAFSAGLDSTTVLWFIKQYKDNIKTFSLVQDDDKHLIETISGKFNVEHHNIIVENIFERLPEQIYILGKPKWHLYSYYVIEHASKQCDSLFTGDGGDEMFGGYEFRYKSIITANPTSTPERIKAYLNAHERDWVPDQDDIFGSALKFDWSMIYAKLEEYFENPLALIGQIFLADFNGKLLYDWIPMYEKWSKASNLTIHSPFLQQELIEFATHLPYKLKYDHTTGNGKLLLREFLASKNMPYEVTRQAKSGFVVDTPKLWKNEGKRIFSYLFDKSRVAAAALINKDWIDKTMQSESRQNSPRYVNKLLGILALEIWYRIFITKEMSKSERL